MPWKILLFESWHKLLLTKEIVLGPLALSRNRPYDFTTANMLVCQYVTGFTRFFQSGSKNFPETSHEVRMPYGQKMRSRIFGKKSHFGNNAQKPLKIGIFGFCKQSCPLMCR